MSDFCRACGASIPKREGEGTCSQCDPHGVIAHLQEQLKARWCGCTTQQHADGACRNFKEPNK